MNVERASESLKVLFLFGLLMLCGIDVEPPAPAFELVLHDAQASACVHIEECVQELWMRSP